MTVSPGLMVFWHASIGKPGYAVVTLPALVNDTRLFQ
jgi:hypothetical protein